ncbi:MAG: DUF4245 domain-containing protein [Microcella sp.]|uniref:DUF4245 domain-containing protein n=1 Tax=Microcella sp. TaxID=1913979 RepID=UPI00331570B8
MTPPAEKRVVAELGRPETPEETAARVAESRKRRRANQSTKNLVLSLIASLGIVLFLIIVVVQQSPPAPPVDYQATAAEASAALGADVQAPVVPPTWTTNRADLTANGGVREWYVGFLTDTDGFIALVQGFETNPTWLDELLRGPTGAERVEIAGIEWSLYDRRGVDAVGNRQYALVTEATESTIVLYGTASEDEFALVATAIAADLPAETENAP